MARFKIKLVAVLTGLFFSHFTQSLLADDSQPTPAFSTEMELDSLQHNLAWLGGHIDTLSNRIDLFFAPEETVPDGKSLLMLGMSHYQSEQLASHTKLNYSVRVNLPKTQERWNLYIESYSDADETAKGTPQVRPTEQETQTDGTLGLATLYKFSDFIGFKGQLGTRFTDGELDPYIRLRLRYETSVQQAWWLSFEPGLFWKRVDGTGKEADLTLAYQQSEHHFFRSHSRVEKLDALPNWQLAQMFEWQHRMSDQNRLSYQLGRHWDWNHTTSYVQLDTYAQVRWRHRLYKKWLFLSTTPGVHAPLQLDYQPNIYITVALEAYSRNLGL